VGDGRGALLHRARRVCWFFGTVDRYTTEVIGWRVAKIGDPWGAALEPIRQGLTTAFGTIAPKIVPSVWRCAKTMGATHNRWSKGHGLGGVA